MYDITELEQLQMNLEKLQLMDAAGVVSRAITEIKKLQEAAAKHHAING
jgi:hypothetical protein